MLSLVIATERIGSPSDFGLDISNFSIFAVCPSGETATTRYTPTRPSDTTILPGFICGFAMQTVSHRPDPIARPVGIQNCSTTVLSVTAILRQERSPRVECFVIEKTGGGLRLYMKYPLRFAVAALICHASLFASGISAELSKGSAAALAVVGGQAIGYRLHPHCTEKNSAPDCISVPQVVSSPQPTYSEEARNAKLAGSVVLVLIVDEKGNPTKVSVVNSLGMGLNEKAIEAVKGWKFTPAFGKDGKPVAAKIAVEVDFHL